MKMEIIFRDAVPAVAGVIVYDHGDEARHLGRYTVSKIMKLSKGNSITRQTYYKQRPAALAYAKKFLHARAEKAGTNYQPGSGSETMLYQPIPGQWEK